MISPEVRALCTVLLFPLLLSAETVLPRPPETPFIYEYSLPPGPALPIDEYVVGKTPASQPVTKDSVLPAPLPAAAAPAPPRASEPARPSPSPPVGEKAKNSPAASTAPAESAAAELTDLEPDLYARLDDSFSLYFSGDSWLFTESYPDEKGVEYRGRVREAGGMRFSFRARSLGRYLLAFVLGGAGGGAGETRRVLVEILPEEEFLTRIGAAVTDSEEESVAAEEQIPEGEIPPQELYPRAWELLLAGEYAAGYVLLESPELEGLIAKPELAAALFLAGILADADDAAGRINLRGSGFSAAERGKFIRHTLDMSRRFGDSVRLQLLHAAADEFQDLQGADAIFFDLAEIYQKAGEFRDIEAAMRYYSRVVDEFPLSPLWDEAHARRIYLERHFLLVR